MVVEGLDPKYTQVDRYIVAFFDVLGVKNKYKQDDISTLGDLWWINHYLLKEQFKNKKIVIKTFSDNFLLAIKTTELTQAEDFNDIGNVVGNLYSQCLRMYGILIRGAIVVGNMHIDENIVLGDALIKAYKLESEVAIYPRIIVDRELIKVKSNYSMQYSLSGALFQDADLQWCLNGLRFCNELMEKSFKPYLVSNITKQYELANKTNDDRVLSKINWVINYVNSYYYQNYNEILLKLDK